MSLISRKHAKGNAAGMVVLAFAACLPTDALAGLARDDYMQVVINSPGLVDPFANDNLEWDGREYYTQRIVEAPRHGTLEFSRVYWPAPQVGKYRYTPDPDFSGRDSFRYELCWWHTGCTQAVAHIDVKATLSVDALAADRMGSERVGMNSLPALAQAYYTPSPLVAPQDVPLELLPDPTPGDPWNPDSNMAWETRTIPASAAGEVNEYRILVGSRDAQASRVHAYVGIDLDGDGAPSPAEMRCFGIGQQLVKDYCETVIEVAQEPVTYWVAGHSHWMTEATAVVLDLYEVRLDAPDGKVAVVGPATAGAGEPVHLQVSWRDDGFLDGDRRVSIVRLRSDAGTVVGDFPFWLNRSREQAGLPLTADEPRTFDIAPGASLDRVFIDVPEGATRLQVVGSSPDGMPFHVVRQPGGDDPASSTVPAAPNPDEETVLSSGEGDEQRVSVSGAELRPGRWYVVPRNAGQARATVTLTASIQAMAPRVRPGSYFNPARPGSGLMLYPAGNERVGLWYTYEAISFRPTWYYLQAPGPGESGIWHSPIYRQAWYGDHALPTVVGQATVTPMGPDVFAFTYTLHGETGSEIYSALGRGCPSAGGAPIDVSSHWFNPARAGTGYSVQTWSDYEFIAGFLYDEQGSPMHLTAERSGFGGASAELLLQRLTGPCPTCAYSEPVRQDAGILHRTLTDKSLSVIRIDAAFDESWPLPQAARLVTVIDEVQLLGGPGTTQGCSP